MLKLIIRIVLKALAILYIFPLIQGISFYGDFYAAFGLSLFFSLLLAIVEVFTTFIATILTISTLGLALLVIIPLRIFGFWILPTICLVLISHWWPDLLIIQHWYSAAFGGLVLLAIGLITGKGFKRKR